MTSFAVLMATGRGAAQDIADVSDLPPPNDRVFACVDSSYDWVHTDRVLADPPLHVVAYPEPAWAAVIDRRRIPNPARIVRLGRTPCVLSLHPTGVAIYWTDRATVEIGPLDYDGPSELVVRSFAHATERTAGTITLVVASVVAAALAGLGGWLLSEDELAGGGSALAAAGLVLGVGLGVGVHLRSIRDRVEAHLRAMHSPTAR